MLMAKNHTDVNDLFKGSSEIKYDKIINVNNIKSDRYSNLK